MIRGLVCGHTRMLEQMATPDMGWVFLSLTQVNGTFQAGMQCQLRCIEDQISVSEKLINIKVSSIRFPKLPLFLHYRGARNKEPKRTGIHKPKAVPVIPMQKHALHTKTCNKIHKMATSGKNFVFTKIFKMQVVKGHWTSGRWSLNLK